MRRNLTPAVFSYDGLQYQHIAPNVLDEAALDYLGEHLKILSGFYGILSAFDGVVPYRLEMQARLACGGAKNLYAFWGNSLYDELVKSDNEVLNLASKEYSKAVESYVTDKIRFVTCVFGSLQNGKIKVKATEAKMARGEMVRRCAEENVQHIDEVKKLPLTVTVLPENYPVQTSLFLKIIMFNLPAANAAGFYFCLSAAFACGKCKISKKNLMYFARI